MKITLLTTLALITSIASAETHSALTLRHRESRGVGYNQGYSTVDYYFTSQNDKLESLLNLRGHLFNNAKAAGNAGVGFRYSLNDDSSRIGFNLFYDVRDTERLVAQQIGSGFEWISSNVDIRVNGYLPIGKLHNFRERTFQGFTQNHVLIRSKFIGALPSVEGEIGTALAKPFYLAVGSYYLFRETTRSLPIGNAVGWKGRFDVDMGHYFTIGMLVTRDPIFKTRVQGYLAINIPLGPWKSMKNVSNNFEKRRIIRNEIIPIQSKKRSKDPLIFEENEMPRIVFVNNQASPFGNGTFESPFSSLKEAERSSLPGDVIYVYPGDGTPRHMDEGIVLKDSQILASSGSLLQLNDFQVPAQTPGHNPTITNIHLNEPFVTNPGKTEKNNFFYMDPWEYMKMYDVPSYSFDTPSYSSDAGSASTEAAPYNDPSLDGWVFADPN